MCWAYVLDARVHLTGNDCALCGLLSGMVDMCVGGMLAPRWTRGALWA